MNIQHRTLANHHCAYVTGASDAKRVILLLHGTGGNENDLLGLGAELDPTAHLLSPRGNVLEHGMPRFFRRFGEGRFDVEDIIVRSKELAAFLNEAVATHGLEGLEIVAVGYSNGANIASAVLLLHPGAIDTAVLLRPMLTIVSKHAERSPTTKVLLLSGTHDPIVPRESVNDLLNQLKGREMQVTHVWQDAGHQLTHSDVIETKAWLAN